MLPIVASVLVLSSFLNILFFGGYISISEERDSYKFDYEEKARKQANLERCLNDSTGKIAKTQEELKRARTEIKALKSCLGNYKQAASNIYTELEYLQE